MNLRQIESPVAFNSFGDLLRYLRRRARLQQRDLAIAVGYSESQICRLEQNQRLPDLTTLVALFVPALNLEDEPELARQLLNLGAAARGEQAGGVASVSDRSAVASPNAAALSARAPARTQTPLNNLPAPLTPLVDRTHDLAVAIGALRRADVRLLTLVGPPGIGKTRLSVRVAADLSDQFADGVFFVALAPIRDPALVLPSIAQVLGVKAPAGQPLIETMRDALRDREMLLLLDNFEQVLAAATHVAELLRAAPRLKVLATSRAALHLSGEHLFAIPPLGLPNRRALPPAEHAGYQRAVDTIKAHSGDEQVFVAAWATGRAMSVDQVIAAGSWATGDRQSGSFRSPITCRPGPIVVAAPSRPTPVSRR